MKKYTGTKGGKTLPCINVMKEFDKKV